RYSAFGKPQGMQASQMLNTGKVAMIVESVPNLDFIHSLSVKWDVAPLPRFSGKPPLYFRAASGGLSISANCQNPLAAWETIKWLVTQSPYNSPGPVLNDTDFVTAYEEKYPILKDSNFRQVWKLSEQFDGGDVRDFVRYSAWTSQAILGQLSPKLDLLYAGKISLTELEAATDEINGEARRELKILLDNNHFNPYFKAKISDQLESQAISLE
ncbi:extracellular solute-binding protein, partial [bacterium]|nr:extracellular solute-binding protein [bacterium]